LVTRHPVIAIAGRIGVGKTTVSRGLAHSLEADWVSFGGYLRRLSRELGREPSREALQDLGNALIRTGWLSFCSAVLHMDGWVGRSALVVDGVRHVRAIEALEELAGPDVRVFYLDVDDEERARRLESRGLDIQMVRQLEADSTESEHGEVRVRATDVVDANGTSESIIQKIRARMPN
jgi:dephospho-CoA kinase